MKFKRKDKFEKKLLVYPLGISRPLITPSGIAIKEYTYTDNYLTKKLVPFIRNLPENTRYIFWLDLAGGSSLLGKSRPILTWTKYKMCAQIWKPSEYTRNYLYRWFLGFNQRKSLQRWLGKIVSFFISRIIVI